jgi:hypothetical protein
VINRRRFPGVAALDRARAVLIDIALRDRGGPLAAGLAQLESWESLAALAETPWLSPARRPSAVAMRTTRHRLRLLGSSPANLEAPGPGGSEPVHLRGICRPLPGADGSRPLWRRAIAEDETGRWVVEEGSDFTLSVAGAGTALVQMAGGRLINAARLDSGDEVSVFGLLDEVPDLAGLARSPHGRGGLTLALRSGSELPLLVSRIRRYDQG